MPFSILISNFLLNISFPLSYDKFVGTDEATTCVGIVIRNKKNGNVKTDHMWETELIKNITVLFHLVLCI